jgi:hypothetical protein
VTAAAGLGGRVGGPRERLGGREPAARLAPTLIAAALAAAYVIVSPPSIDLASHLFRARLFDAEGFGAWNDWWYSGHDIVGYSVLFPAISAALTPQLAGALAAIGTAAVFERLARCHFGPDAWLGATVFGAATAIDLFTGRLPFAFGALPALAAILALDGGRPRMACALAFLAALCSPVAALFTALVAAGYGIGAVLRRREARAAVAPGAVGVAALVPVGALAIAFPEGGTEPFPFTTLLPILALAAVALVAVPRTATVLRAGTLVYAAATLGAYLVSSPVGGNVARLGTLLAAPLAALIWWPRHRRLLLLAAAPLLYLGWQAPVRDVANASGDPSTSAAYYRPLLGFLAGRGGPPFRIEIPFTASHWEAYRVATRYPLARGWERQLDIADNALFYRGGLTPAAYERWMHENAVRFVAVADAPLDYSARAEVALINRGVPFLREVWSGAHWRIYAVARPTPIVGAPANLRAMGGDWLTLDAPAPASVLVRVRYSPYWALTRGSGCVAPEGAYTRVNLRRSGVARLAIAFAPGRIRARSPRCA